MRHAVRYTMMLAALTGAFAAGCDQAMHVTAGDAKLPADEDSAAFLDRVSDAET